MAQPDTDRDAPRRLVVERPRLASQEPLGQDEARPHQLRIEALIRKAEIVFADSVRPVAHDERLFVVKHLLGALDLVVGRSRGRKERVELLVARALELGEEVRQALAVAVDVLGDVCRQVRGRRDAVLGEGAREDVLQGCLRGQTKLTSRSKPEADAPSRSSRCCTGRRRTAASARGCSGTRLRGDPTHRAHPRSRPRTQHARACPPQSPASPPSLPSRASPCSAAPPAGGPTRARGPSPCSRAASSPGAPARRCPRRAHRRRPPPHPPPPQRHTGSPSRPPCSPAQACPRPSESASTSRSSSAS